MYVQSGGTIWWLYLTSFECGYNFYTVIVKQCNISPFHLVNVTKRNGDK